MDIETGEDMAPKPKKTIAKKKSKAKKSSDICAICRNRIAGLVKKPRKKRNVSKK